MAKCAEKKDADDLLRTEKPRIWNSGTTHSIIERMSGGYEKKNPIRKQSVFFKGKVHKETVGFLIVSSIPKNTRLKPLFFVFSV